MKRLLSAFMLVLFVFSLVACSGRPAGPSDSTASPLATTETAGTESPPATTATTGEPSATTQQATSESTAAPARHAAIELFGPGYNPYGDMALPDNFKVFAVSFSKGSEKLGGKCPFVLYMTGSGNMFAAVAYHADVAGLGEDEKNDRINEYLDGGFCEFQGKDGRVVTIRKTNPDDDRYEYVDGGCLIEIAFNVAAADVEKYDSLIRDNYNLNALAPLSEYFDVEPDLSAYDISVNLHKDEACFSVAYEVTDVDAVRRSIAEKTGGDWWEWNGLKQTVLKYSMINTKLTFDSKGGAILADQISREYDTALGDFAESAVSLSKLGFGFDEAGVCGVFEEREPNYKSVAIHRPEWGEFADDWNIEYMDQVNGYDLRITYHLSENKYHVSLKKDDVDCAFDNYPATDEVGWEYPDLDTVHRMFNDAFGTKEKELYHKPLAAFEQFVQDHFGMSVDELFALPKQ